MYDSVAVCRRGVLIYINERCKGYDDRPLVVQRSCSHVVARTPVIDRSP